MTHDQLVTEARNFLQAASERFANLFSNAFETWSMEQKIALIIALLGLIGLIITHPPRSRDRYGEIKTDVLMVLVGVVLIGGYTSGVILTTL